MNRRALLTLAAACIPTVLTGCSGNSAEASTPRTEVSFVVENETTIDHSFGLRITDDRTGGAVVDDQFDLSARRWRVFPAAGTVGRAYQLSITVDGLPPLTREWRPANCTNASEDSTAATAVFVVREESRGFEPCEQRDNTLTDANTTPSLTVEDRR